MISAPGLRILIRLSARDTAGRIRTAITDRTLNLVRRTHVGRNIVQKIIDVHHAGGEKKPGKEIAIRIAQGDQVEILLAGGRLAYTNEKGSF